MKKIKNSIILICILCIFTTVCCMGCGDKTEMEKEMEKIDVIFHQYPDTLIEQKQNYDNVTIQLNAVAFEVHRMILDYTIKGENLENYYARKVQSHFGSKGDIGCNMYRNICFIEKGDEFRTIEIYELNNEELCQEDIGETVELQISFPWKDNESEQAVSFQVKIPKIFETEKIDIQKDISNGEVTTRIQSLEISQFYTILNIDCLENEDFFDEKYGYEVTDENGNVLMFKGGVDNTLCYGAFPDDCRKAGITVILYKEEKTQNLKYDYVSDTLEVKIPTILK